MDKIWGAFWLLAANWLIPIGLFVVSVGAYLYLLWDGSKKVKYVRSALLMVRALIGSRLGEKAASVIDAWLSGLNSIQDGSFSVADGIDQFVKFIVIAAKNNGITLTPSDIEAIEEAVTVTLEMVDVKSKPAQQVVAMMMAEPK